MRLWQKVVLGALAVSIVGLGSFTLGLAAATGFGGLRAGAERAPDGARFEVVADAFAKIRATAVDPPPADRLVRGAVRGMVDALRESKDPYALFYSPKGYRSFQDYTSGQFSGIGVWLKNRDGALEVVSVLPSSPAVKAGLKRGDIITSVDGTPSLDMTTDEAVSHIKGPKNTTVELEVLRGDEELSFSIERESLDYPNVISHMSGEDLGYVRLYGFSRGAGRQVRSQVRHLKGQGAEGIVLDLRDNGGGLFSEAIDVASVFIERGKIVSYKERSKGAVSYDAQGDAFESLPVVALVNEGTASASEIVAGALQDRGRAVLIGETTYGKGSVQEVVPLRDTSALKLTIASYSTPNGRDINGRGISPDVVVDASPAVQRERAVEILRGIVVSQAGSRS